MKTFDPRHTLTQLLFMLLAFIMPTAAMAVNDASDDESPEAIEEEEVVEEETGPSLDEAMMLQISGTMESYLKELQVIADGIPKARKPKLASLEKKMTSLNVRWEAYNKVVEAEVAQSEVLLEMVSQFKNLSQAVNDSLDIQKQRAEAIVNFEKFEDSLPSWSKKYDKLQREALEYSLVTQTAQLLARVKNEEQLLSQELDQKYGEAKAAAELNPSLKERMKKVEQHYLTLKGTSEEIQATEYKSLFDRAKDYVLMFAGVAVILMFLSMVQNKIKQVKAAREAAKQYKDMLMNSNKEIPTICLALMAMLFTACSSRVRNVVVQHTPQSEGMTVSDMKISDDCRTMTLKARVDGTPDLLDLADTTKVNIKVTEYMQYLIPCIEDVYPSLVSIKGIGPEQVKKRGLVMHVLVDLTQPSKGLSKQREYVNILRKLFCHDNLYLTFMLGEGKTSATMAATDYVVSNYISAQSPLRETVFTDEGELMSPYIYQSTLTMLNRLDSSRKEVGDSATYRLLMLFTDGKVYDDDDYPLDPDHFDVQEKLIRKARTLPDNLSVYYVDLSANEEDEINENNMLRMLCQETKGQCLPSLDNVKLDDFILSSFNIDYDDYIIELRNPEKKYFFGNHRYVCLTFTNKSDSLLAKAYKDYQIASIYQPKHIGDMPLPSIAFQGIVLGLVIMIAVYLVMQFLLPFLSYLWFRYRYVVKYTGPNMSVGNIIVPGECYLCKAPFTLGEKVVVKCKHVTHEECWKDNGHRCPEHGVHCPEGSHYYNKSNVFDPSNASFYMRWVLIAMVVAVFSWSMYVLYTHGITYKILDSMAGISGPMSPRLYHLPVFANYIAFFLTLALSTLTIHRRQWYWMAAEVFARASVATVLTFTYFTFECMLVAAVEIYDGTVFLDTIPWTLAAGNIAFISTWRTRIRPQRRHLLYAVGVGMASNLFWGWLGDMENVQQMVRISLAYMVFAVGIAVSIAKQMPRSEHYFLRVSGPIKLMDIALYKWLRQSPDSVVTIGKSVNCTLQITWDLQSDITPLQAEIRIIGGVPRLKAVDGSVFVHNREIPVGSSMTLYHGDEFQIGLTHFRYLET